VHKPLGASSKAGELRNLSLDRDPAFAHILALANPKHGAGARGRACRNRNCWSTSAPESSPAVCSRSAQQLPRIVPINFGLSP